MPLRLVDREPVVAPETLVASLVPPPRFAQVRFSTYLPDPGQPSQSAALAAVSSFATQLEPVRRRRFGRAAPTGPPGLEAVLDRFEALFLRIG